MNIFFGVFLLVFGFRDDAFAMGISGFGVMGY